MELSGFKTRTESGIIVIVGGNTNLTLNMEVGVLEEQVTVTAVTPMVDSKKTSVGTNVTQEILQSLPSARDPWVVLQMAPSVIVDRENIGGAESGQQSNYVARGSDNYDNNVWAMDGIVITDPSAIGASPSYYDFDAFEEMQITVGGSDVTVQTGGIALNMVTRRGGNNISLGGRFYFIDEKFQAKNEDKVAEIQKTEKYFLRHQQDQEQQGLRLQPRPPDPQGQGLVLDVLRHPGHQDDHDLRPERRHPAGELRRQDQPPDHPPEPFRGLRPHRRQEEIRPLRELREPRGPLPAGPLTTSARPS